MELSSLSYWEYINIVGHYNRLLYKENDMSAQLLSRGFTKEQIEIAQKAHRKKDTKEIISCNLHIKGSLQRWKYPYFDYAVTLFDQYHKHGTLPFPGAHVDQPAKVIELFELLEQLSAERDEMIRREQERELKKQKRKNGRR